MVHLFRSSKWAQVYRRRADRVKLHSVLRFGKWVKRSDGRLCVANCMWNSAGFKICMAKWNRVHQNETQILMSATESWQLISGTVCGGNPYNTPSTSGSKLQTAGTRCLVCICCCTVRGKLRSAAYTVKHNHFLQASGHYMYRPVVTICTAQWPLCVKHSGHYMYRRVVNICTAQWSIYVPHNGHYM